MSSGPSGVGRDVEGGACEQGSLDPDSGRWWIVLVSRFIDCCGRDGADEGNTPPPPIIISSSITFKKPGRHGNQKRLSRLVCVQ